MRRVALIADVHFGASSEEAVRALEAALSVLSPDVTVIAGDLTQRGRWREFHQAAGLLGRLQGDLVSVAGNHDIPRGHAWDRFVRPMHRYDLCVGRLARDRFGDEEVAVVGVHSARAWGAHWNWAHGRVSKDEIEAAGRWLGERASGAFGALVVHHPPVLFTRRRGFRELGRGRELLAMLRRVGAEAVMSGHLHATGWRVIDGVLHMQAGTGASSRVRGEANAFLVLDVHGEHLEIEEWLVGETGEFAKGRAERIERHVD